MSRPTQILMEFIGGPYDGFAQILDDLEGELAPDFEMPVQQNLIRVMAGDTTRFAHKVRTVAVYRLSGDSNTARYMFGRTRRATAEERPLFDDWCQQILENWRRSAAE